MGSVNITKKKKKDGPQVTRRSLQIFETNLNIRSTLTGKGELGQGDVTVHAVVDEADAHALGFHLHARDQPRRRGPLALAAAHGQGKRLEGFGILKQPTRRLFQLACGKIKRRSVQPVCAATQPAHRGNFCRDLLDSPREPCSQMYLLLDLKKKKKTSIMIGILLPGNLERSPLAHLPLKFITLHDLAQNISRSHPSSTITSVGGAERTGKDRVQILDVTR